MCSLSLTLGLGYWCAEVQIPLSLQPLSHPFTHLRGLGAGRVADPLSSSKAEVESWLFPQCPAGALRSLTQKSQELLSMSSPAPEPLPTFTESGLVNE